MSGVRVVWWGSFCVGVLCAGEEQGCKKGVVCYEIGRLVQLRKKKHAGRERYPRHFGGLVASFESLTCKYPIVPLGTLNVFPLSL